MFDLVFSALFAWNYMFLLLAGMICLGVGIAVLGHIFYTLHYSKPVKAKVSAVYAHGAKEIKEAEEEKITSPKKEKGKALITLFMLLPLIFCAVGAYFAYQYLDLVSTGVYADAIVIRNDSDFDSEGGTTYKAVLSFMAQNGQIYEVKDSISYGHSPSYPQGQKLGVYYRTDDPTNFVIHDFWHNILGPAIMAAFGLVFIGIVSLVMRASKPGRRPKSKNFAGEMYTCVYSYQKPDGELAQYVDESSSSLLPAHGKEVALRIIPQTGYITRIDTLWPIVGIIFLGAGILLLSVFIQNFNNNPFVIIFTLAAVAFLIFRIRSKFDKIPENERKKIKEFAQKFRSHKLGTHIPAQPLATPRGRKLEEDEIRARYKIQQKQMRSLSQIGFVIAIGLLVGSYYTGKNMLLYQQSARRTEGTVTALIPRSSDDGYVYYAQIKFIDAQGQEITFNDSVGSSPPIYEQGEKVNVFFMEDNIQGPMIDRGYWNWTVSVCLGLAGAIILLYSIRGMASGARPKRV